MIQTQFELTGNWSSSDEGQQFMLDLSADTGIPLFSMGKSFNGKDIHGMEFGNGSRTIIITGGVHRSEPASREMVMMKARDLAYNVDDKYSDYLAVHRIIIIPTVQPDVGTRVNAQGININRDAYYLETPEMQALMTLISDVRPDVYIDFHERGGTNERVEFIDPMSLDPNTDSLGGTANADLMAYSRAELESIGYTTAPYPSNLIGMGKTVSVSAMFGCVTMTPETYLGLSDGQFRITALGHVFEAILRWHTNNHTILDDIRTRYDVTSIRAGDSFTLLNGNKDYYNDLTKFKITAPKGYIVNDIGNFQKFIDTYNIVMDADNFVPIEQKAGRLIPYLLDPLSDLKVATAKRVESDSPVTENGRWTKVYYDEWREVFIKNYLSTSD